MGPMRLVGIGVVVLALTALTGGRLASAAEGKGPVAAVFELDGRLPEAPSGPLGLGPRNTFGALTRRIEEAAHDGRVKAVVLVARRPTLSLAQAEELRASLKEVQKRGKPVYAHATHLDLESYALLSAASELSVVPTGGVEIPGLLVQAPYLRGLLERIGVEPSIVRVGKYKTAGEMFVRKGPSAAAKEQMQRLLDGLLSELLRTISSGRDVKESKVQSWIDRGLYTAREAKSAGLIDAVRSRAALASRVRSKHGVELAPRYGKPSRPDVDLSNPFGLLKLYGKLLGDKGDGAAGPVVAVVHVNGMILPGAGGGFLGGSAAHSEPIRKALDRVAEDDKVKAVVLRVKSPGGSGTASEIILDAAKRVGKEKPLVVSMSDVAASGGYYVSTAADAIFANPSTLTGSIGVVGGKFATTGLWKKLGVKWKTYRRGANAGILRGHEAFTDEQRARVRDRMKRLYARFKQHVVAGRGDRLEKPIDKLAGGRVYTGRQAKAAGLVDHLGGLDAAIEHAAEQAGVDSYEVRSLPEPPSLLQRLTGGTTSGAALPTLKTLTSGEGSIRAIVRRLEQVDPSRARAVLSALRRVVLLRREGAALTMPVLGFHGG